jgi:hypothetical protein
MTLETLIRPKRGGFKSYDAYRAVVAKWRIKIIEALKRSLNELVVADKREQPIPRSAVLVLAVAANYISADPRASFNGFRRDNRALIREAEELCVWFRVKGLLEASSWRWNPDELSTLEKRLHRTMGRMGTVHCRRCGRILTNRDSVRRGLGPVCLNKDPTLSREKGRRVCG